MRPSWCGLVACVFTNYPADAFLRVADLLCVCVPHAATLGYYNIRKPSQFMNEECFIFFFIVISYLDVEMINCVAQELRQPCYQNLLYTREMDGVMAK